MDVPKFKLAFENAAMNEWQLSSVAVDADHFMEWDGNDWHDWTRSEVEAEYGHLPAARRILDAPTVTAEEAHELNRR